MEEFYFKPWVGKHYEGCADHRLLILGESHYSTEPQGPIFTIDLTRAYSEGRWIHRYWTNVMQAVDGRRHWEIDKNEFWSRVAFYNYIQELVGEGPGIAPSQEMWEKAKGPFFDVMRELKPSHILVVSKRLWVNLPRNGYQGTSIEYAGGVRESWVFQYEDGQSISTWIPHPSYGFSARKWHPMISAFLNANNA